jgi:DNA-binding transcriptional LysR family regulator
LADEKLPPRGFQATNCQGGRRRRGALAFVAAGFGVAVVSEPLQKIRAKDVIFRDLAPEDSAWVPAGAAWKPDEVSAPVVSRFVDILVQVCAGGNGESHAPANSRLN